MEKRKFRTALAALCSTTVRKTRPTWARTVAEARRTTTAFASSMAAGARGFCRLAGGKIKPWKIVFALILVVFGLGKLMFESGDKYLDPTIQVREFVQNTSPVGISHRGPLEYLNRDFDGFACSGLVNVLARWITGEGHRMCLVPAKHRESLKGIDVAGADLNSIELMFARLSGANLSSTNLSFSNMGISDLSFAQLIGARMHEAYLRFAVLTFANLVGAELIGADARGVAMSKSNLEAADLSGADFSKATLRDSNFTNAVLRSTILRGAHLLLSDFTNADLTDADLMDADITQEQLDSACGSAAPKNLPEGLVWRSGPCVEGA